MTDVTIDGNEDAGSILAPFPSRSTLLTSVCPTVIGPSQRDGGRSGIAADGGTAREEAGT